MGKISDLKKYNDDYFSFFFDNTVRFKEGNKFLQQGQSITDHETKSLIRVGFLQRVARDRDVFTKTFDHSLVMAINGKYAFKLFHYICSNMSPNDYRFYIDMKDCLATLDCSRKAYSIAVYELGQLNIIHITNKQNIIHVNPAVVFNGNRPKLYDKEHKKLEQDKIFSEDQLVVVERIKEYYSDGTLKKETERIALKK